MKLLIAMSLFLAAAAVLSYSGERAVSADLPRLSPGEFVASVLLAAARPIAVAVLWSKTTDLREERDYDHLLALYQTILKLEPTFAPAWEHFVYDMTIDLPFRETDPEKQFAWAKKGILLGYQGVAKTPHSSRVAGQVAWTFMYYKVRYPRLARRVETDRELNPERLDMYRLALKYAKVASPRRHRTLFPEWTADLAWRRLLEETERPEEKRRLAREALDFWREVVTRTRFVDEARKTIKEWHRRLADLGGGE